MKVSDLEQYVEQLYKSLVLKGLQERPGKTASLQGYCNACLLDAEKTNSKSPFGTWFRVITKPLSANGGGCEDRVSLMLILHEMYKTHIREDLREHLLNDEDPFMRDVLSVYRAWHKTVALRLDTDQDPTAFERLMPIIERIYGGIAADEIKKMVESCRRHESRSARWDFDWVWPVDQPRSDARFFATIRNFLDRFEGSQDPILPVDLGHDRGLSLLALAANSWTAELMGPPQVSDMRLRAILPDAVQTNKIRESDIDNIKERIADVNIETMRFKVQLYEILKKAKESGVITDVARLNTIMHPIEALRQRGRILVSLQDDMRTSWDSWVKFAKMWYKDRV